MEIDAAAVPVDVDIEALPHALQKLVAQLREEPPTIEKVDLAGPEQGGDFFRVNPSDLDIDAGEPSAGAQTQAHDADPSSSSSSLTRSTKWWSARLWVLGLIADCSSLRVVMLANCNISKESEVERLCQGLKGNPGLRWLQLDGNLGFGSDFGCQQLSDNVITGRSSSASLETLEMDGVGLKGSGASRILTRLLSDNLKEPPGLQALDLEHNPECLADEHAAQLLAQIVSDPRVSKCLRDLRIRETGLTALGASRLAEAFRTHDGNTALKKVQVGPEPVLSIILNSLVRCSELVVSCSQQAVEVEALELLLRNKNSAVKELWMEGTGLSTEAWRCILQAAGESTLSCLSLEGSSTSPDHSLVDDVYRLAEVNARLRIQIRTGSLRGSRNVPGSEGFFYCSCPSCCVNITESDELGAMPPVEQWPKQLRPLILALTAEPPTIEEVDVSMPQYGVVRDFLRLNPRKDDHMLWKLRMLLLGLIGTCPSLRVVKLDACNISTETEVERLCEGLASNMVLEQLLVDRNLGFGSDLGCQQVSRMLARGAPGRLRRLELFKVGLTAAGLCYLLLAVLDNPDSCLEVLDVGDNPGCLAEYDSIKLLARLLVDSTRGLRELYINGTGLTVVGAMRLSAALAQQKDISLQKLKIGGPDPIVKTLLESCPPTALPQALSLVCSNQESSLAQVISDVLFSNSSSIRKLWLTSAPFSPQDWGCIFQALASCSNHTLAYLGIVEAPGVDHTVITHLHRLCLANPNLTIDNMVNTPLQGSRLTLGTNKGHFYCCCATCSAATPASPQLTMLMSALSAGEPSITAFTPADWPMELTMPRTDRSPQLIPSRLKLLNLIGSCASLKSIELPYQNIIEEGDDEDVAALCTGLSSNGTFLEMLDVGGNFGFGTDYGCEQLARVISNCSATLRVIDMQNVGMMASGLQHLTQALSANTNMSNITLGVNDNMGLGDIGAGLLAQLLDRGSTLVKIYMNNIGISRNGAQCLSRVLKHNNNLQYLSLGQGKANGSTHILLSSLFNNQTLKKLSLRSDANVDKGLADRLVELLQTSSLIELRLYRVHFRKEEWRTIFKALENNQVLKVLEINDCNNLDPVFNDLMQLLQVNTTIEEIKLQRTELWGKGKVPLVEEALRRNKQRAQYVNVLLKEKLPLAQPSMGRLFLCGPPYAGKSTMRETMVRCCKQVHGCTGGLRAFVLGQPGLRQLKPRTQGIEIDILCKDNDDMQVATWDMAGQEQYYVMHDYLFPNTNQACIFVFVYSPCHSKAVGSNDHRNPGGDVWPTEDFHENFLYWLRFISSNSRCEGDVLPIVGVVITNLDRLQSDRSDVVSWAQPVVDHFNQLFEGVLQVSKSIHVVKAYSITSVQPVLDQLFDQFRDLLKKKLAPVFQACSDMSVVLAKLTMHSKAKLAPIVRLADFHRMCFEKVKGLADLINDQTARDDTVVEQQVAKARETVAAAVTAYLHDIGSVVYYKGLDFVVVNPNWLGNVFLARFIRSGADVTADGILPDTNDGLIEESHLLRILAKFLKTSKPACANITEQDLLLLLLKLELCYKEDHHPSQSGFSTVHYFVPNSIVACKPVPVADHTPTHDAASCSCFQGAKMEVPSSILPASIGDLKWEVVWEVVRSTGIRLQCDRKDTKFLTVGFFPRLQICLRKLLDEKYKLTPELYRNMLNSIHIRLSSCEILVESSGEDDATFLDVLIQSDISRKDMDLVQERVVKEIQAFCATPQGCPGIALVQYIIRPECVAYLTPCLDRQVVSVEELKSSVIEEILSKFKSMYSDAVVDSDATTMYESWEYKHPWPAQPNLHAVYTKASELLDDRAWQDVLGKVQTKFDEKRASVAQVEQQVEEAVWQVVPMLEIGRQQDEVEVGGSSNDIASRNLERQTTLLREVQAMRKDMNSGFHSQNKEIKSGFHSMKRRLDEQRDLILNIVPSLVKELKVQQQEMQTILMRGVNEVLSFMRASQNTKLPRLPYLVQSDGIRQKLVAFFTIASAHRLHFMCENRGRVHYVENQSGVDLQIQKPGHETLRFIMLCSYKVLYILAKSGLQVGAGLGGIVPEFQDPQGAAVSITSQTMGNLLDSIQAEYPQFSTQSEVDELASLHEWMISTGNDKITGLFQLYRVEFLQPDPTGKLPRCGWVCGQCRVRGKGNQSLRDLAP